MDIALDKVCELILRAREIDVKEGVTDPDSGSNPIDDGSTDVLTSGADDSTEEQVREFIAGLNDDERHDLVAITWIGRGDFEPESGSVTPSFTSISRARRMSSHTLSRAMSMLCSVSTRAYSAAANQPPTSLGRRCATKIFAKRAL